MCSISGITNGTGVEKMMKLQKHRAPDEEGVFKDEHIELGMGRLKIIDLKSTGLSPYQEDEFVLLYNGEIYNYIELQKELKKLGWTFRTTSDTEVLLKAWRQWGIKMFPKLNGMFAFALYNKVSRKLILARDIVGEKPLYYYTKGGVFAFASEAKAFAGVIPLEYQENRFFDAFQHVHDDTLWKDVKEVPAAHYLEYDVKKNTMSIYQYWDLALRDINQKTAGEELEALLDDAVRIRTRSDVPYALYYSGGIDSALISTFHDFKHKFYFDNTLDWKKDFFENIDTIGHHLDFPVGSLSSYPLWKLAQWASKKVKVVISGEGADEIFGGYVRYLPVAQEWQLRTQYPSYNAYLFAKYFRHFSYLDAFATITARNDDVEFVRETLRPYFERFKDPITAMGYADFKLILPSLLQMGDRQAGAHGIENRCPFLDKRIIEFGFSLPPELKINGLKQKILLRKILKKRGLTEPLYEEKRGLTITFNQWFDKKDWDRSMYFDLLKKNWHKRFGEIIKSKSK
ncbi:MAG: asparagine synthase-related protein [bacterium]|nr:asparagine synthase-related protein [bacterium]